MPAYCGLELAALKIARLALSTQMSIARRTSVSVADSEASDEPAAELGLDERGAHAAGDLAGVVAAHAVGQDDERRRLVDDGGVFVVVARPAGIRGAMELERHHRHGSGGASGRRDGLCLGSCRASAACALMQPLADERRPATAPAMPKTSSALRHAGLEPRLDRRIGHEHLAGELAEQAGAERDDDRQALHDLHQHRAAGDDERDRHRQADHQQRQPIVGRRAGRRRRRRR